MYYIARFSGRSQWKDARFFPVCHDWSLFASFLRPLGFILHETHRITPTLPNRIIMGDSITPELWTNATFGTLAYLLASIKAEHK
jgi:hypothetical protein